MEVVKRDINRGDISLNTYSAVWEECYKDLPSAHKFIWPVRPTSK